MEHFDLIYQNFEVLRKAWHFGLRQEYVKNVLHSNLCAMLEMCCNPKWRTNTMNDKYIECEVWFFSQFDKIGDEWISKYG